MFKLHLLCLTHWNTAPFCPSLGEFPKRPWLIIRAVSDLQLFNKNTNLGGSLNHTTFYYTVLYATAELLVGFL